MKSRTHDQEHMSDRFLFVILHQIPAFQGLPVGLHYKLSVVYSIMYSIIWRHTLHLRCMVHREGVSGKDSLLGHRGQSLSCDRNGMLWRIRSDA